MDILLGHTNLNKRRFHNPLVMYCIKLRTAGNCNYAPCVDTRSI